MAPQKTRASTSAKKKETLYCLLSARPEGLKGFWWWRFLAAILLGKTLKIYFWIWPSTQLFGATTDYLLNPVVGTCTIALLVAQTSLWLFSQLAPDASLEEVAHEPWVSIHKSPVIGIKLGPAWIACSSGCLSVTQVLQAHPSSLKGMCSVYHQPSKNLGTTMPWFTQWCLYTGPFHLGKISSTMAWVKSPWQSPRLDAGLPLVWDP